MQLLQLSWRSKDANLPNFNVLSTVLQTAERASIEMEQQLREKDLQLQTAERVSMEMEQQLNEQVRDLEVQLANMEKEMRQKDEQNENLQENLRDLEEHYEHSCPIFKRLNIV